VDDPRETDALHRLEEQLKRASDAAERLIAEAAASIASGGAPAGERPPPGDRPPPGEQPTPAGERPPPAGWQAPPVDRPGDGSPARDDLELLTQLAGRMRDLIPPELQRRLGEALRELLLAVRALIDWYLDRLERRRSEPVEVKDIPIL
jgi:hypothetical protein